VHIWFEEFLKSISLDENSYTLLTELIKEEFKKIDRESPIGPKHYEKIKHLETKLEKIQDLFIEGDFSKEDYNKTKKRFKNLIEELKEKEAQLAKKQEVFKLYKDGLKSMENFNKQYIDSDIEQKRLLIGSIFPEKFQFDNKKVRTADINPILLKIASINKGLKGNKKRDKSKKNDLSQSVPLTIPFSNSFYQNLTDIYALKELLYNEGLADYNGLPLIKPHQSNTLLVPNGY